MNRITASIFAVFLCFAVGHALKCYKCDFGLWKLCITSEITCPSGEHCYSEVGKAAGFVDIQKKGCLAVSQCNTTSTVNFPSGSNSTVYKTTRTCCNTDLCNAAPGLPTLGLALTSLSSLLVVKLLL
ncbi:sperm acrosome membrane-associated protein 4-like [Chanos chanos]|uniref:Sperm acrosome membrane-associated protein 4-like n=1 Tax=Chanos chanos TaxID=29144 RepID=A0A6J2WNZ6_CHACN|nr:sperm acrosome membrane-associated protein 4-like [Chanos chanos]